MKIVTKRWLLSGALMTPLACAVTSAFAAAPTFDSTLDPLTIPKYVTPLVIPPVMNNSGMANDYDIAVRQFKQQILPGGIWNTLNSRADAFPATPVWSYGPAAEDRTAVANLVAPAATSQFNYPAYTVEAIKDTTTTVDWTNDLVDPATGKARPHLLPIDRTLHWANPEQLPCSDPGKTIDCRPDAGNGAILQKPYEGPVPIITHVHGAHVTPESDGYPEAWYLPNAVDVDCTGATPTTSDDYACNGTLVNNYAIQTNTVQGTASFTYTNDQPSTTLWYHDHSLGMTRNNVYAGPAGFWLVRDSLAAGGETGLVSGTLPGPAPVAGQAVLDLNVPGNPVRGAIREIPVVIQDRSFNDDGTLFYPGNRAFFEEAKVNQVNIPFIGDKGHPSDISPIWNPEAFFNTMVVNGVTWPALEVEPDLYRFRLLNGCNSRFLNLSLQALDATGAVLGEVPFYQIGAEQSLMPNVVKVETGFRTILPGDGSVPAASPAPAAEHALLMGLAERADVIVDFTRLPVGTTTVRMLNTAPDAPFGGFPDIPANPATTGQVMEFHLIANTAVGDGFTLPEDLVLSLPDALDPANLAGELPGARDLALIEEISQLVCVFVKPNGMITHDKMATPAADGSETCLDNKTGALAASVPMGPREAVLGTNGSAGGTTTLWADPIATNPASNSTETWELWNFTADGHPIHVHLVKFKVLNREVIDPVTGLGDGVKLPPEATEIGWKDTVVSYPGEITRVNATFDIDGLYVWHCHIVEHEDNEMMVPYCVGDKATASGCNIVP